MERVRSLVIARDPAYMEWVRTAVSKTGEATQLRTEDVAEVLQHVENMRALDFVFMQFDVGTTEAHSVLTERLLERFPELTIIGLSHSTDQETTLAAMRAGTRDFFVLGRDDAIAASRLRRLLRRGTTSGRAGAPPGRTFLVLSPQPAETAAFTALHLAIAAKEQLPRATDRVLLIDLAIPAAAASIFLNLNPTYSALDAINDAYRCDATLIESAFPRHPTGIHVLSLPEDLWGRPEINVEDVMRLLHVLRSYFALVVVTIDGQASVSVLAGLVTHADQSLLVCDQSILRSRRSRHLLRGLRQENCPLDRMCLIVDNHRPRLGLSAEDLAGLLDLQPCALLAGRLENRIHAMNTGQPLFEIAPRDPYCAAMRALARMLVHDKPRETVKEPVGLLGRLFG